MEDHKPPTSISNLSESSHGFGWYCAVFSRWAFIIFFSFDLLTGLVFDSSWIRIILDTGLLALLILVPKSKRKYGWILIGAVAAVVTVWIFLPENDSGNWQQYVFDDEINAINNKYGVPTEQNAAPYYMQIQEIDSDQEYIQQYKLDKWDPKGLTLSRPWTAEEFPELAEWLKTEQENIAPFFKAVQYDACWFEIDFGDDHLPKKLEHIGPILHATDVIQRLIYLDLGNNDISGALKKCTGLLKCASHLQHQSPVLDQYLSMVIFEKSLVLIQESIIPYPVDNVMLNDLEKSIHLYELNWPQFISRFIEFEKAQYKHAIALTFEINQAGQIRLDLSEDNMVRKELFNSSPLLAGDVLKASPFWQARKRKLLRLCERITKPLEPQDFFERADIVFQQQLEQILRGEYESRAPETWLELLPYRYDPVERSLLLMSISPSSLKKRQEESDQLDIRKNGTLIICALKRYYNQHRQWPDSLAAIKGDLTTGILSNTETGQRFMYYKPDNSDTFVLYSYNGDDNRYQELLNRPWILSEAGMDDFLIWPKKPDNIPE